NLVTGDTNAVSDAFVYDRVTGTTERVSVSSAGAEANGTSFAPAISADGRFVAFPSEATNLVPGDTNGATDVLVRDRRTGTTERVSVSSAGAEANGTSFTPAISADGRLVAFASEADDLVIGDTNQAFDVFVHDGMTGTTERVSVDSTGAQANAASIEHFCPALSADGRFVAFESDATNLVPVDTNAATDVFVRDRLTATTDRVSVDSTGAQANDRSDFPAISADGSVVAFVSTA